MAKSNTIEKDEELRRLQEENAALKEAAASRSVRVNEGAIVPNANVPVDAARPAFGANSLTFGDITNHNWCVRQRVVKENKRMFVPELNQVVDAKTKRSPCTMFTLTIRRNERDSSGNIAPREITRMIGYPFYTFDNEFTRMGISPKDVAFAIWQMRDAWGTMFEVYQMTEAEVATLYQDRMSPEVREARQRMADAEQAALRAAHSQPLVSPVEQGT